MWDFFSTLLTSAADMLHAGFVTAWNAYVTMWVTFIDYSLDALLLVMTPLYNAIADQVVIAAGDLFDRMLPTLHRFVDGDGVGPDTFRTALNTLNTMYNLASAFVPIRQAINLYLSTQSICGGIRLARWVKSCIPTVGD